jgi:hypothetical protein
MVSTERSTRWLQTRWRHRHRASPEDASVASPTVYSKLVGGDDKEPVQQAMDALIDETNALMEKHRPQVQVVAAELTQRRRMTGAVVAALLDTRARLEWRQVTPSWARLPVTLGGRRRRQTPQSSPRLHGPIIRGLPSRVEPLAPAHSRRS